MLNSMAAGIPMDPWASSRGPGQHGAVFGPRPDLDVHRLALEPHRAPWFGLRLLQVRLPVRLLVLSLHLLDVVRSLMAGRVACRTHARHVGRLSIVWRGLRRAEHTQATSRESQVRGRCRRLQAGPSRRAPHMRRAGVDPPICTFCRLGGARIAR